MSGWRPIRHDELSRLWPAVRASHLMASAGELEAFYLRAPWRVRVSDAGDAMILRRWRFHLDALAIRSAWAPAHRIGWLIAEAKAVGRAQGYSTLVSPLISESALAPYRDADMRELEPIVALQGSPRHVADSIRLEPRAMIRAARHEDLQALVALDAQCFDDFWRYGEVEFEEVLERERVTVAEQDGQIVGYTTCSASGASCTLGRLGVAALARRGGLGSLLLRDVAVWSVRRGALALSLCTQEANRASRALYWRSGLTEIDERYSLATCGTHEDASERR